MEVKIEVAKTVGVEKKKSLFIFLFLIIFSRISYNSFLFIQGHEVTGFLTISVTWPGRYSILQDVGITASDLHSSQIYVVLRDMFSFY